MFGRGGRKARAAKAIEVQVEAPGTVVEASSPVAVTSPRTVLGNIELDATFMAMMAQLDDSLAAMARACDRIEEAVAGASRHYPVEVEAAAAA